MAETYAVKARNPRLPATLEEKIKNLLRLLIPRPLKNQINAWMVRKFNNYLYLPNFRYWVYHLWCQARWRSSGAVSEDKNVQLLRQNGYLLLPAQGESEVLLRLARRMEELLRRPEKTYAVEGFETFATHVKDTVNDLPETLALLTPDLVKLIEAYYHSHMKLYYQVMYRTHPTTQVPKMSWLWHSDVSPPQLLKIMFLLNDTTERTGAMKLIPLAKSTELRQRGFRGRYETSGFEEELEDRNNQVILEGKAGTVVVFNPGLLFHRAAVPKEGYRDVVTFAILPSTLPWQEHLQKVRPALDHNVLVCSYPQNPFTV